MAASQNPDFGLCRRYAIALQGNPDVLFQPGVPRNDPLNSFFWCQMNIWAQSLMKGHI